VSPICAAVTRRGTGNAVTPVERNGATVSAAVVLIAARDASALRPSAMRVSGSGVTLVRIEATAAGRVGLAQSLERSFVAPQFGWRANVDFLTFRTRLLCKKSHRSLF